MGDLKHPFNWKKLAIYVAIALAVLTVGKDMLIKTAITTVGSSIVGAPLQVGGFSWNLLTGKVRITNLRLDNPTGFDHQVLADVPEIAVDYNWGALLKGRFYFPYLNVNVREVSIIRNKEGKLNVDALKIVHQKQGDNDISLAIDVMKLNMERTVFKDYSRGDKPVTEVFDVGLRDKTFKNIKSVQQLVTVILVQGMGPAAIKGAAVYTAAAVFGVGLMPVGAIAALVSKDHARQAFHQSSEQVYKASLNLLQDIGYVVSEDQQQHIIKGKIDGGDVTVRVERLSDETWVEVSCRKYMLPKIELANGFLYQLSAHVK